MAQYTGTILTIKGRDLQAKVEAGTTLTFTKVKIGDGQLGQGQTLEGLNDLVHPLKTLSIASVQAESGGLCRVRSNITNSGVTQGFYIREVGLFAQDPDVGEILYAISVATAADYLPPEGGTTAIDSQFDIIVLVGNASSLSAVFSSDVMPIGGIILWSGSEANIPNKWALCNGQTVNGHLTPDLRGRFVVGAGTGSGYNVGATGGAAAVALETAQLPVHSHGITVQSHPSHTHSTTVESASDHTHNETKSQAAGQFVASGVGAQAIIQVTSVTIQSGPAGAHSHDVNIGASGSMAHTATVNNTGSGSTHENRPPYYALCYIMKVA